MNKSIKRTIALIRHAKSSWSDPSLTDFERPLNKRGMRDAPRTAAALANERVSFDKVLCSDALRAKQTLSGLKQQLDIDENVIEYRQDMYAASTGQLLECIQEQPHSVYDIALIGHNPGMEELANDLSTKSVGFMPTCCVIQLLFECATWSDLPLVSGQVVLRINRGRSTVFMGHRP